ncbi:hypothetical protein DUNSADRAFT_7229, partial [Dunaliella salina]
MQLQAQQAGKLHCWGRSNAARRMCIRASAQEQQQQPMTKSAGGRMTYRPQSFEEMVDDAAGSVKEGIAAGLTRMEVEFPPLPTQLD